MVLQVLMYATNTGMGAGNMKLTLACECAARMLMTIVIPMATMTVVNMLMMLAMMAMTAVPVRAGLPDMIELIRSNAVVVFTCANDYADVKVRIAATFSRQASRTVRERCFSCRFKIVRLVPPLLPV